MVSLCVCLSVAFKFLNNVTDCYKTGVKIMMTLGGHHYAIDFNSEHLTIRK